MILKITATLGAMLFVAGTAHAQGRGPTPPYGGSGYAQPTYNSPCPANTHGSPQGCICDEPAVFYSPSGTDYYPTGSSVPGYGDAGAGYPGSSGYNVRLYAPGVRVVGQPVTVPSGQVYVQGAPIYVDAPPVTVKSPQIYLARPEVHVRPSRVTVEPPTVHVAGCNGDSECEAAGTSTYNGSR